MGYRAKQKPEIAVKELRLFISLLDGAELEPNTRLARQLAAARRAVAGYEEAERATQDKRTA